jgi:hypothetical protein
VEFEDGFWNLNKVGDSACDDADSASLDLNWPCLDPQFGSEFAQCALNAHCSNSFVFAKNCPNFD